jgi:transmembrane sensor
MELTARIPELIFKELRAELNESESKELKEWIDRSEEHRAFYEKFISEEGLHAEMVEFYEFKKNVFEKISREVPELRPRVVPLYSKSVWLYAAAVIFVILVAGGYVWRSRVARAPIVKEQDIAGHFRNDLPPGGNKAVLMLADGSSIVLDSARIGVLTHQSGAKILKLNSGQLVYNNLIHEKPTSLAYNTLVTPRGGQYEVVLPDGSKVWLNAASSLRYPTSFTGKDREVELKGEAYFEVAKNEEKPFRVRVNDIAVSVLGTSFNIMAYPDEPVVKTTLEEGTVKVLRGSKGIILYPGQQARAENNELKLVRGVDMEEVIAWKNGLFKFNGADIEAVMRQIGRWYNVDIVYQGAKTTNDFSGIISRNTNISNVLKILEYSGVHFRIENNTVTVLP